MTRGHPGGSPLAEQLPGVPVTVLGPGPFGGGVAAARWLVAQGAGVTVTDLRSEADLAPAIGELGNLPIEWRLGEHVAEDFERTRWIVANPAVRPDNPWLERGRSAGAGVTSELELFLLHAPCKAVLITGTQGKSSTTHFLAQLLGYAGHKARAGGNIGRPLLAELADLGREEVAVVEVSSYQLEYLERLPLERGAWVTDVVVTNLHSDHLERHGTLEEYASAKARALRALRPGGRAWLPASLALEGPFREPLGPEIELFTWNGDGPRLTRRDGRFRLDGVDLGAEGDLGVAGEFQRDNSLVALGVAHALGADAERLASAVARLEGLPHRVEDLPPIGEVRVIDNGVSTTPDSTLAALGAVDGEVTLLVGGQPKRDLSFEELVAQVARRKARVVTFGAAGKALLETFAGAGAEVRYVDQVPSAAVEALRLTPDGGTVLFSPACASFDAYLNFRERALDFRSALDQLRS